MIVAMTTQQVVNLRALVFSNFPIDFFEKNLQPRFRECLIDVVRVVSPDRSFPTNLSDVEIVVAMVELMNSGQVKAITALARRFNKRFVRLRRSGDWMPHLHPKGPPVDTTHNLIALPSGSKKLPEQESRSSENAPAPPEILEGAFEVETTPDYKAQAEEAKEMLALYVEENEQLRVTLATTIRDRDRFNDLSTSLEKQLDAAKSEFATYRTNTPKRGTALEIQQAEQKAASYKALTVEAYKKLDAIKAEYDALSQAYEDLQTAQSKTIPAPPPGFSKEDLVAFLKNLEGVRRGEPAAFKAILERALKVGLEMQELLSLIN